MLRISMRFDHFHATGSESRDLWEMLVFVWLVCLAAVAEAPTVWAYYATT